MHAQVVCVVKQAWIPHKWYVVGEDKPCLRSNETIKSGEKYE